LYCSAQLLQRQRNRVIRQCEDLLGEIEQIAAVTIGHIDHGLTRAALDRQPPLFVSFGARQQSFHIMRLKSLQRQNRAA